MGFDALPGLQRLDTQVHELAAQSIVDQELRRRNCAVGGGSHHMMFVGNPGTGKTTTAQLMAQLLHATGVVTQPHMVVADRSMLIGEFLGTSALKTRYVVEQSLGGVLFIDEAYAFADTDTESRSSDRFAAEALTTLIALMEEYREALVVILAGYPLEMASLMKTNTELPSRISNTIVFDDYNENELWQIFGLMAQSKGYQVHPDAELFFRKAANAARTEPQFGNARWCRNLFETCQRKHALHLSYVASHMPSGLPEMLTSTHALQPDPSHTPADGTDSLPIARATEVTSQEIVALPALFQSLDDAILTTITCEDISAAAALLAVDWGG